MKPNAIIAGDEICAGISMEDAEDTGPIKNAIVITFESREEMAEATSAGHVAFDFMRDDQDEG